MVLLIVRYEGVINPLRQVFIGVAGNLRLIGVTQHRIEQHVDGRRFEQNAGVAEVASPHTRTLAAAPEQAGTGSAPIHLWLWPGACGPFPRAPSRGSPDTNAPPVCAS